MYKVFIACLFIFVSSMCWGAVADKSSGPLVLSIATAKSQYLKNEPLKLFVSVTNCSNSVQYVADYFESSAFQLTVRSDKDELFRPRHSSSSMEDIQYLIAPGDSYSLGIDITKSMTGITLHKPGVYYLSARYKYMPVGCSSLITLQSNTITIDVAEPEGVDADAITELQGSLEKLQNTMWKVNDKQIDAYEQVIHKYPDSKYTPYFKFYLAQTYEYVSYRNLVSAEVTRDYLYKASALYRAIAKSCYASPPRAVTCAGRCYAAMGLRGEAIGCLDDGFFASDISVDERSSIIGCYSLIEDGIFFENNKDVDKDSYDYSEVMHPLLPFASALGYQVQWGKNTVTLTSPSANFTLVDGEQALAVGGVSYPKMLVSLNRDTPTISNRVLAALLAARYGPGMALRMQGIMSSPLRAK